MSIGYLYSTIKMKILSNKIRKWWDGDTTYRKKTFTFSVNKWCLCRFWQTDTLEEQLHSQNPIPHLTKNQIYTTGIKTKHLEMNSVINDPP